MRETRPSIKYKRVGIHPAAGRQGVCTDHDHYWVSGSGTLSKYDRDLGVEYFMDGEGKNIQVAVYDADTLKLKRVFPFRQDTGVGDMQYGKLQ